MQGFAEHLVGLSQRVLMNSRVQEHCNHMTLMSHLPVICEFRTKNVKLSPLENATF